MTIDLETAFLFLSVVVYAIFFLAVAVVVCSGIGKMLRRKRKEQTYRVDEYETHVGHESYRGEGRE